MEAKEKGMKPMSKIEWGCGVTRECSQALEIVWIAAVGKRRGRDAEKDSKGSISRRNLDLMLLESRTHQEF